MADEFSKSYSIRQAIQSTVKRLYGYFENLKREDLTVNLNNINSVDEKISLIQRKLLILYNIVKKLKNCYESLTEKEKEIINLQKSLSGDELKSELVVYQRFLSKENFCEKN